MFDPVTKTVCKYEVNALIINNECFKLEEMKTDVADSSTAIAMLVLTNVLCLAALGSGNSNGNGRRGFARFQRGDQGPDVGLGGSGTSSGARPIGGPNVCLSSMGSSSCCPGWTLRGLSGLCLTPLCRQESCGLAGRCIKPNLCLCQGGRIAPTCQDAKGA